MPPLAKLIDRGHALFENIRWTERYIPTYLSLSRDQVDKGQEIGPPFKAGQHYFQVRINEMFLAQEREFFKTYDPIVFAATEFAYGSGIQMVPQVIGPNLLSQYERNLPGDVRYINTPISGLHPYIGDDFVLIAILYRAKKTDYLRNLLKIIENVVDIFDPSTALGNYMKMANVILDGIELILGTQDTEPILAVRHTFSDRGIGDQFEPGYYVLIDAPDGSVDRTKLWVRGDRLCIGNSLENSEPYRAHDFVLFSVIQAKERTVDRLPFIPLWQEAQKNAMEDQDHSWDKAKAQFKVLWQEVQFSPDLTRPQKKKLIKDYEEELRNHRDQARKYGLMGRDADQFRGEQQVPEIETDFLELGKMLDDLD